MIIGHIGARAGSKGVPNKNFRIMHGKHVIDWSLISCWNTQKLTQLLCPLIVCRCTNTG